MRKGKDNLRDLQDNIKLTFSLCLPKRGENGANTYLKKLGLKLSLTQEDIQIQEIQKTPDKRNPNRPTLRHVIIKISKVRHKERILKATTEKQLVTYKRVAITQSVNLLAGALWTRRAWYNIVKVLKEKYIQPRIFYPAKLSFTTEGEIKFSRQAKAKGTHHH